MRRILFFILCLSVQTLSAQLIVNLQLPAGGMMQKAQLWNFTVTNTTTTPRYVHIEMLLMDAASSVPVMSATTQVFLLSGGASQITSATFQPIQYNILSSNYNIDVSPNGLLPVGSFEVCYSFMQHSSDYVEKIAEVCNDIIVEPLAPPQLIQPADETALEANSTPLFTWLPPMPATLFRNLLYDWQLVEILPGQTTADAMQQNLPHAQQFNVTATSLVYPAGAPSLDKTKKYAWRVIAKTNGAPIAQSESWMFLFKPDTATVKHAAIIRPFARFTKDNATGYVLFTDILKLDYYNETADNVWRISVTDLTDRNQPPFVLQTDTVKLKYGQNLLILDVRNNGLFKNKHLYQLLIHNARNEKWVLRLEYRRSEE